MQTACYLIKRTPSPTINNKIPYYRLFQKEPSYENLKVFGCLAFFKINPPTHKFEARATKGVFLGYVTLTKGYKILNLETQEIVICRM